MKELISILKESNYYIFDESLSEVGVKEEKEIIRKEEIRIVQLKHEKKRIKSEIQNCEARLARVKNFLAKR